MTEVLAASMSIGCTLAVYVVCLKTPFLETVLPRIEHHGILMFGRDPNMVF